MTTISCFRFSVGDNFWEAQSIFQAEGKTRNNGEPTLGEMHIIVRVCFGLILDMDVQERGRSAWGRSIIGCSSCTGSEIGREYIRVSVRELSVF